MSIAILYLTQVPRSEKKVWSWKLILVWIDGDLCWSLYCNYRCKAIVIDSAFKPIHTDPKGWFISAPVKWFLVSTSSFIFLTPVHFLPSSLHSGRDPTGSISSGARAGRPASDGRGPCWIWASTLGCSLGLLRRALCAFHTSGHGYAISVSASQWQVPRPGSGCLVQRAREAIYKSVGCPRSCSALRHARGHSFPKPLHLSFMFGVNDKLGCTEMNISKPLSPELWHENTVPSQ